MTESPPSKRSSRSRVVARKITYAGILAILLNDVFVLPIGYSALNDSWLAEVMALAIVPGTLIAIGYLIALGHHQPWRSRKYPLLLGAMLLLSLPLGSALFVFAL